MQTKEEKSIYFKKWYLKNRKEKNKQSNDWRKTPQGIYWYKNYLKKRKENYVYKKILSPEERFLGNVNKKSGDGCWEWIGYINKNGDGYASFKVNTKSTRVHRFSYELHKGKIPKNMLVCHSCDNRICVNPEHLWLGTIKDNLLDRDRKGRNNKGKKYIKHTLDLKLI